MGVHPNRNQQRPYLTLSQATAPPAGKQAAVAHRSRRMCCSISSDWRRNVFRPGSRHSRGCCSATAFGNLSRCFRQEHVATRIVADMDSGLVTHPAFGRLDEFDLKGHQVSVHFSAKAVAESITTANPAKIPTYERKAVGVLLSDKTAAKAPFF